MEALAHVIEFISVEIILIGLVFLLFLVLSWNIWGHRQSGIYQALAKYPDSIDYIITRTHVSRIYPVVALVIASQLGTVLVRFSDEILDSQNTIAGCWFLYVPAADDILKWQSWLNNDWEEEDRIKSRVLRDALERTAYSNKSRQLLRRHIPSPTGSCDGPKHEDHCAMGFFQHANAVIAGGRGGGEQREALRHEKHAVQLLSVVFVGIWIAIFVTAAPFAVSVRNLFVDRSNVANNLLALGQVVAFVLLLWFAEGVMLRLWTEQTQGYYRRVVHSYVAIASYGDPAMDVPSDLPTTAQ